MSSLPLSEPIRLNYRRIYVLPTKRGFGFVLLITLLLSIAFIYNNNLVFLLSFLLASLFFITILHTVKSLEGLQISEAHNPDIFAGEFTENNFTVENSGNDTRYSIQLEIDKKSQQVVDIEAQQKIKVSLPQRTTKRGWFIAGKPTISSCYPFGLFRAWKRLNIEAKTLVYPKALMQDNLYPENKSSDNSQGSTQKGSDDFYGLQCYQTGDGVRHIHWRAFAKGQGLFTRQYSGDQSSEIWLDYDHTIGATQEERLSQMCRWVLDADKAGVVYGFKLTGLSLEPNQGVEHSTQCLRSLALA